MDFNKLLLDKAIDPKQVLVLRHRPSEPQLNKVLPWLAAEKPDLFNAYQQTQGDKLERVMQAMEGSGYVASFIGHEAGKALFVGLYAIGKSRLLTYDEYWSVPDHISLKTLGMKGFTCDEKRSSVLWFDLLLTDFYADWKGKLIVRWPSPERSWWRRAHRNEFPVLAVLEDSVLDAAMLEWDAIDLTWEQLGVLPTRMRYALSQWRGIYYIFDSSDGKGYIGSAYGKDNLLGRWQDYAVSGHGANRLLRQRDPKHFHFTIIERVSPDMEADDIIRRENSWKQRLHTRQPHGLNDN
jgi:hypothetical protein